MNRVGLVVGNQVVVMDSGGCVEYAACGSIEARRAVANFSSMSLPGLPGDMAAGVYEPGERVSDQIGAGARQGTVKSSDARTTVVDWDNPIFGKNQSVPTDGLHPINMSTMAMGSITCPWCGQPVGLMANGNMMTHKDKAGEKYCRGSSERPTSKVS